MAADKIHIDGKEVGLHSCCVIDPDFKASRVLCSDPWDFVSLWLKRKHKTEAQFYWDQARHFYKARKCISVCAYTSSVLASRKLLMNIAVSEGAKQGKRFVEYIDYLAQSGYVPPKGNDWVNHIREKGNDATHEITPMRHKDATELVRFAEMLLKFIYEFPSKVPSG